MMVSYPVSVLLLTNSLVEIYFHFIFANDFEKFLFSTFKDENMKTKIIILGNLGHDNTLRKCLR